VLTIGLILLLLPAPGTVCIPSDSLAAAAMHHVRMCLAQERGEYDVTLRSVPDPVMLDGTRYTLAASIDGLPREGGLVTVRVEARPDRGRRRTTYVSLKIQRFAVVAVAGSAIGRQQEHLEQVVRFERRETTGMHDGVIGEAGELRHMRSKRLISEGTIITPPMIERTPVVRANAPVTIRVRAGAVVMIAAGMARDEGRTGESVGVRREGSREVLHGTVVDSSTVDVRIP
jgi:flagella basal body P-ring formation protein FlgA